jgi:hypothetical protein
MSTAVEYDEFDAILQHICQSLFYYVRQCVALMYSADSSTQWSITNIMFGVCLRIDPTTFRYYPYEDNSLVNFHAAVQKLNVAVAVRVSNAAVQAALNRK